MKAETIRLRLVGTKRLIMHCGRMADPLDPISRELERLTSKRMKTEADHEQIARVEWHGSLWLDCGRPCLPADALMSCFVGAARSRGRAAQARAGLVVEQHAQLIYDGPKDMDALWEDPRFRLRASVKVNSGRSRTMRTRPCFNDWSAEFTAYFLPTLLNRDQIIETYALAGYTKAVGDWRPQNGTFLVEPVE